jgi:XTP/dITP diphosphohydrolase
LIPLLIATHNPHKLIEFEKLLSSLFSCEQADPSWPTPRETGTTYRENAEIKARSLWAHSKRPCLADDSGLEIDSLKGEPGVHSADFGGENISWSARWNYVYAKLAATGEKKHLARFRCVLCYFDGKVPLFFEGVTEGEIASTPKGAKGFGYDPIFYSYALKTTFGEAADEQKAAVSHRAAAAQKLLSYLA